MPVIKLAKRFKLAGDVFAALMKKGWSCTEAKEFVNSFRDADAVEVVHGRWEDMYGGEYANPRYRCSVCKEKANYKSVQDELLTWHDVQTFATDNNVGSRWIPVTERLPQESGEYLAYCGEYDGICVIYFEIMKTKTQWRTNWKEVTHWMPLPEAPKEVE